MAGIGFKLRTIFDQDTYLDNLKGVVFSSSIAAGPVFFTIIALALLSHFSKGILNAHEISIFQITVVYIFAFSLISTGISQLIITRCLSDLIYEERFDLILPSFTAVLYLTVVSQLIIGLPFLFIWPISWFYKLTALALFVVVAVIWQLMIFLSAVKNYQIVLWAFIVGLTICVFGAIMLGERYGLDGFLHGYAIGQTVLMFILLGQVLVEFRSPGKPEFRFLRYAKTMPQLVIIGFGYNLGIWVDKMIFWFGPEGTQVQSFLYTFSDYDVANFLAYLTVIPSYTYFLVKIETEFSGHFWAFFHAILSKEAYDELKTVRRKIARVTRESLFGLVKLQGTITLLCLLFARDLVILFNIPPVAAVIFQKLVVAVFLQTMLLIIQIFLLYFDVKFETMIVTVIFLISNVIFTFASLQLGYNFYGYGYLIACVLAVTAAYFYLDRHLKNLEYYTFVNQPVVS